MWERVRRLLLFGLTGLLMLEFGVWGLSRFRMVSFIAGNGISLVSEMGKLVLYLPDPPKNGVSVYVKPFRFYSLPASGVEGKTFFPLWLDKDLPVWDDDYQSNLFEMNRSYGRFSQGSSRSDGVKTRSVGFDVFQASDWCVVLGTSFALLIIRLLPKRWGPTFTVGRCTLSGMWQAGYVRRNWKLRGCYLVALAGLGMWWRSASWSDALTAPGGTALVSENGYLVLFRRLDFQTQARAPVGYSCEPSRYPWSRDHYVRCPLWDSDMRLGPGTVSAIGGVAGTSVDDSQLPPLHREFHVGYPLLTAALATPLIIHVVNVARGAKRSIAGLCPACGYDLRATPGRCPECGRPA